MNAFEINKDKYKINEYKKKKKFFFTFEKKDKVSWNNHFFFTFEKRLSMFKQSGPELINLPYSS